ncbi:hypothetical protein HON52_04415 [Candidatus Uhrbacteria bacterium]|jgi:hypothetical protein|nr:hypothetical protein [Candidatus Uhrbacteria bacterium]
MGTTKVTSPKNNGSKPKRGNPAIERLLKLKTLVAMATIMFATFATKTAEACGGENLHMYFGYDWFVYRLPKDHPKGATVVRAIPKSKLTVVIDDEGDSTVVTLHEGDKTLMTGKIFACFRCMSSPTYIKWEDPETRKERKVNDKGTAAARLACVSE